MLIAMLGNALGGMTGWCIGRFIPERKKEGKALAWLHKYGYWALLMTWLPLFGDALPIAAGWLRLKALPCFLLIALGKGAALCGGGRRGAAACRLTAQKAV